MWPFGDGYMFKYLINKSIIIIHLDAGSGIIDSGRATRYLYSDKTDPLNFIFAHFAVCRADGDGGWSMAPETGQQHTEAEDTYIDTEAG